MADTELVIKIDKEAYNRIQGLVSIDYFEHDICGYVMKRIANGKPYEKRPIGHWIKDCDSCDCSNCYNSEARFTRKDCSGKCSNCGELQCCTENFCPHCGADMRGKE